jgi:hypothetical protein
MAGIEHGYNQFTGFSEIPYKIMRHLMNNNEVLWKLCKYPELDALTKTNLTLAEKSEMIYKGGTITKESLCRVFTVKYTEDAVELTQTQMRIYMKHVYPKTYVTGMIDVFIDIFCHNKIAVLSDNMHRNRYDIMFEEVMKTLNGKNVDTLGNLFFNGEANNRNSADLVSFDKNNWFQGYQIRMSTWVG